jgi:hypothetical protein
MLEFQLATKKGLLTDQENLFKMTNVNVSGQNLKVMRDAFAMDHPSVPFKSADFSVKLPVVLLDNKEVPFLKKNDVKSTTIVVGGLSGGSCRAYQADGALGVDLKKFSYKYPSVGIKEIVTFSSKADDDAMAFDAKRGALFFEAGSGVQTMRGEGRKLKAPVGYFNAGYVVEFVGGLNYDIACSMKYHLSHTLNVDSKKQNNFSGLADGLEFTGYVGRKKTLASISVGFLSNFEANSKYINANVDFPIKVGGKPSRMAVGATMEKVKGSPETDLKIHVAIPLTLPKGNKAEIKGFLGN